MKNIVNENKSSYSINFAPYASIALTTIGGFIVAGPIGGALGLAVGLVDEISISYGFTDKHYLGMSAFHYALTFNPYANHLLKVFPQQKLPINAAAAGALSVTISHYSDDFIDFSNKINVPLDAFLTLNKLFDPKGIISVKEAKKIYQEFYTNSSNAIALIKEDISELKKNEFLVNFIHKNALSITEVIGNQIYYILMGEYTSGILVYTLLGKNIAYAESPLVLPALEFMFDASKVISLSLFKNSFDEEIRSREMVLSQVNRRIMVSKATDILLNSGNARKILSKDEHEGKQAIEYLHYDLHDLAEGANKLVTISTSLFNDLLSMKGLISFAPDYLLPSVLFLKMKQNQAEAFLPVSQENAAELASVYTQIYTVVGDIKEKTEEIDLRDGEHFIKTQFNDKWVKIKSLELNETAMETAKNNMDNKIHTYGLMVDVFYYSINVAIGNVELQNIPLIYKYGGDVVSLLSSNLESRASNVDIMLAKTRVEMIIDAISQESNNAVHINSENGDISFKNYSLFVNDRQLVEISDYTFQEGGRYAITGKKGSGKTHTLIDFKVGVVEPFKSAGEIKLPFDQKIIFVNQALYIPKESTLLEALYFPSILKELDQKEELELREEVTGLLEEFGIGNFVDQLDSKVFKASGGERKTFGFIQAILADPDILILDETFNELDPESVVKVQQGLVKHLDGVTMFIIDHSAKAQNYHNFYSKEVHFENGLITENLLPETLVLVGDNISQVSQFED